MYRIAIEIYILFYSILFTYPYPVYRRTLPLPCRCPLLGWWRWAGVGGPPSSSFRRLASRLSCGSSSLGQWWWGRALLVGRDKEWSSAPALGLPILRMLTLLVSAHRLAVPTGSAPPAGPVPPLMGRAPSVVPPSCLLSGRVGSPAAATGGNGAVPQPVVAAPGLPLVPCGGPGGPADPVLLPHCVPRPPGWVLRSLVPGSNPPPAEPQG